MKSVNGTALNRQLLPFALLRLKGLAELLANPVDLALTG